MNPTIFSILLNAIKQIVWQKVAAFFMFLSLFTLIISVIADDYNWIIHSLVAFITLLFFLVMDAFIDEFKTRKRHD